MWAVLMCYQVAEESMASHFKIIHLPSTPFQRTFRFRLLLLPPVLCRNLQSGLIAEGRPPSRTPGGWGNKCFIPEGPSGWYIPASTPLCVPHLLGLFGLHIEKQILATKEYMLNILKISLKFLCKSTKVEVGCK